MKQIYTLVIIIAVFYFPCLAATQTDDFQRQKDSLWQAVKQSEGEEKILSYDQLANCYMEEIGDELKMDTLISLYDDMHKEAVRQNDFNHAAQALYNRLKALFNSRRYDEVIKQAPGYMRFAEKHGIRTVYYQIYHVLLWAYIQKGDSDKALREAQQMYEQAKSLGHNAGMALMLDAMGYIYDVQVRFEDAEKLYRESIRLLQKEESLRSLLLRTYGNLTEVFTNTERYDEALQLCRETEDIIRRHDQSGEGNAVAWLNLYINYLLLYMKTGDYDQVEYYCNQVDNISNAAYARVITGEARIQILISREQYDQALDQAEHTMEMLRNGRGGSVNMIRKLKMDILVKMNRAEEAHDVFWEFIAENDSVFDLQLNAQLDDLRTQYEVDRHIAEKERSRNYFLFALGISLLLAFALGIYIYYSRKIVRKNRELVRKAQQWANIEPAPMIVEKDRDTDTDELPGEEPLPKTAEPDETDRLLFAEIELLIDRGLYKESNLSLDMLAEKTGQNLTYVSKAVSHCTGKTFKAWLNEYRIKEVVRLLSDKNSRNSCLGFGIQRPENFPPHFQEYHRTVACRI